MNVEEQLEHQPPAKKSRMNDPSQEEPAEIAIQNDGATRNKQIRELEISTMDKKEELKELKMEMIALKDEFAKKLSSLKEKCQKKFAKLEAKLEMKNQKLTEGFEEKIKKLEEMVQTNQQKIGEAENEIMLQIREMKVQLPLENWHDLLSFVPRCQLGNVVSQIGDRQFARIIQSFLHDPVKEITLGNMRIIAPRPYVTTDLPMVKVGRNAATNMADWPMPGNIKNFKQINLNYVDMSVLNFLEKIQENSLLTDVNIDIDYKRFEEIEEEVEDLRRLGENLPQALIKIAPFITSIDSIKLPEIELFKMVYNNNDETNKSQLLLMQMMAKTRILVTDCSIYDCEFEFESWENKKDWCSNWLYTPRDDGKPRMLKSNYHIYDADCALFVEHITEDFEMANNPISFIIYTRVEQSDYTIEDISLENIKTNEQLVIKTKRDDKWYLLISRYPLNATKTWIEANEKEIFEWDPEELNRIINMDSELTINHNLKLKPDE